MKEIQLGLKVDQSLVEPRLPARVPEIVLIAVIGGHGDSPLMLDLMASFKTDESVVGFTMIVGNALEIVEKITKQFPEVQVVALTKTNRQENGAHPRLLGLVNCLSEKTAPGLSLRNVTDFLELGERVVVQDRADVQAALLSLLTPRQRQVLVLIADGKCTKEIAWALNISVKTVESHRINLMQRLEIHTVAGLVRCAIRTGMIAP